MAPLLMLIIITASSRFCLIDAGNCQEEYKKAKKACPPKHTGCYFPRCDGTNYAPYGCSGSWCFCQTSTGEGIEGYGFNAWENSDCQCARDVAAKTFSGPCKDDGSYASNCLEEYEKAEKNCPQGHTGCYFPRCDGTNYASYGCRGTGCFCQTSTGEAIGEYGFLIWEESDCQCARDEVTGNATGRCNTDGSYVTLIFVED